MLVDPCVHAIVNLLHDSPFRIVIKTAGIASHVASLLACVPKCSQTLLDFELLYARTSVDGLLDSSCFSFPESTSISRAYASSDTALRCSLAGFQNACNLVSFSRCPADIPSSLSEDSFSHVLGVGIAGALSTSRERRGANHAHICVRSLTEFYTCDVFFSKDSRRSREEEDYISSLLALYTIAVASKLDESGSEAFNSFSDHVFSFLDVDQDSYSYKALSLLQNESSLQSHVHVSDLFQEDQEKRSALVCTYPLTLSGAFQLLQLGYCSFCVSRPAVWRSPKDLSVPLLIPDFPLLSYRPNNSPLLLLPGSFNPIHQGHVSLLRSAEVQYSDSKEPLLCAYELSAVNADKPSLPESELIQRLEKVAEVAGSDALVAAVFPQTSFVLGVDTAIRVLDPKYYGGSKHGLIRSLADLMSHNCRFVVGGRLASTARNLSYEEADTFVTMPADIVPPGFESMFLQMSEAEFRVDASSSSLREASCL